MTVITLLQIKSIKYARQNKGNVMRQNDVNVSI